MEGINHNLGRILVEKLTWAKDELYLSTEYGRVVNAKNDFLRVKIIEQMIGLNDLMQSMYDFKER